MHAEGFGGFKRRDNAWGGGWGGDNKEKTWNNDSEQREKNGQHI